MNTPKTGYVKPVVTDYGELQDLTNVSVNGGFTDVPLGFPSPAPHQVFSNLP